MQVKNKTRGREALEVDAQDRDYLKTLLRPNGWRFTLWTGFHFGLWLLLAGLILTTDHLLLQILYSLVLGNVLHALTILQHDCGHGSGYRSERANLWVGRLLAWFIIMPFTTFSVAHRWHHRSLGNPKQDPDDWFYAAGPLLLFVREWIFVPRFILISLLRYGRAVRITVLLELLFNLAGWAVVAMLAYESGQLQAFVMILLVPLALLAFVINPISRGYEHYPLTLLDEDDESRREIGASTVTVTSPLWSFLWANITYHVEHHMYPAAPFYNLPKIHRLMLQRDYLRAPYPLHNYPLGTASRKAVQVNN